MEGRGRGRVRSLLVRGLEKVRVQLSVGFEREEGCTLSAGNINAPLQTARSMDINRFLLFVTKYLVPMCPHPGVIKLIAKVVS